MVTFGFNPVAKPSHGRNKQKRKDVTKVTDKVRKEIARRSMELLEIDIAGCEHCGYTRDLCAAHMDNASQMGSGSEPWNVAYLCGSHGIGGFNGKGGCHDWADNTKAGREWKEQYGKMLRKYYKAA